MTDNEEIELLLSNIDNLNLEELSIDEPTIKEEEEEKTYQSYMGAEIHEEHKIVSQLDEVTKESEAKATELFDIMNDISNDLLFSDEKVESLSSNLNKIKEKLNSQENKDESLVSDVNLAIEDIKEIKNICNHANNVLFEGMSLMQYQDINRQKIERVVNVMRSLIKYLNLLFEGTVEDNSRTSTPSHISGDHSNDLVGNDEDLESLIASFK